MPRDFLDNLPDSNEIWKGIGGHFDSLGQIIAEFIDNSLANIISTTPTNRNITIHFEDQGTKVKVSIEDTGSGISNLAEAFRLGGRAIKQGPMNEHGFGMKHALASANPDNNDWIVCTRTKDNFDSGFYSKITAPYLIHHLPADKISCEYEPWPGQFNGTGTYVSFACSRELFNTIRLGIPGQPSFQTIISYLIEDLGFWYSGLIQRNASAFTVSWKTNGATGSSQVVAIKPSWQQFYTPGEGREEFDLGNGRVELFFAFGAMNDSGYRKYYKRNMSTSGLEIRLNGRVLAYNLFKEVWNKEKHNMYNHLLVTVDIVSDKPDRLPPTRTSKNGFRQGDPRLEALYDWVRRHMPNPPKEIADVNDERDLFDELQNQKNYHVPDPKTVLTEQFVFTAIGERIRVDLYLAYSDKVIIYEGKKDDTTVKDIYQLKMYWDGAIIDGLNPTNGILIASRHPNSVKTMVEHLNRMSDVNGNKYKFLLKTWHEEGIQYPT